MDLYKRLLEASKASSKKKSSSNNVKKKFDFKYYDFSGKTIDDVKKEYDRLKFIGNKQDIIQTHGELINSLLDDSLRNHDNVFKTYEATIELLADDAFKEQCKNSVKFKEVADKAIKSSRIRANFKCRNELKTMLRELSKTNIDKISKTNNFLNVPEYSAKYVNYTIVNDSKIYRAFVDEINKYTKNAISDLDKMPQADKMKRAYNILCAFFSEDANNKTNFVNEGITTETALNFANTVSERYEKILNDDGIIEALSHSKPEIEIPEEYDITRKSIQFKMAAKFICKQPDSDKFSKEFTQENLKEVYNELLRLRISSDFNLTMDRDQNGTATSTYIDKQSSKRNKAFHDGKGFDYSERIQDLLTNKNLLNCLDIKKPNEFYNLENQLTNDYISNNGNTLLKTVTTENNLNGNAFKQLNAIASSLKKTLGKSDWYYSLSDIEEENENTDGDKLNMDDFVKIPNDELPNEVKPKSRTLKKDVKNLFYFGLWYNQVVENRNRGNSLFDILGSALDYYTNPASVYKSIDYSDVSISDASQAVDKIEPNPAHETLVRATLKRIRDAFKEFISQAFAGKIGKSKENTELLNILNQKELYTDTTVDQKKSDLKVESFSKLSSNQQKLVTNIYPILEKFERSLNEDGSTDFIYTYKITCEIHFKEGTTLYSNNHNLIAQAVAKASK